MRIGRYDLLSEIGRGGMGVVLKATDSQHGRTVAIKLVKGTSAWRERDRIALVREAGTVASLEHPNIVSIYDVTCLCIVI